MRKVVKNEGLNLVFTLALRETTTDSLEEALINRLFFELPDNGD
jgi:hypothetical protein